tara:strand:+ start:1256 stop:1405 length:150 start_codon:yes stop_codon:yes gene_type:complete
MDKATEQHVKEWESLYSRLKNTVPTKQLSKETIEFRLKSLDGLLERSKQ